MLFQKARNRRILPERRQQFNFGVRQLNKDNRDTVLCKRHRLRHNRTQRTGIQRCSRVQIGNQTLVLNDMNPDLANRFLAPDILHFTANGAAY